MTNLNEYNRLNQKADLVFSHYYEWSIDFNTVISKSPFYNPIHAAKTFLVKIAQA